MARVPDDFVALILTNRRSDRVVTYDTLRRCGYTGPIVLVIDDEDPELEEYRARYPDEVAIFCKNEWVTKTDTFRNDGLRSAVVFARNACFEIVRELGYRHFMQLDDDYTDFYHRVAPGGRYMSSCRVRDLDSVFSELLEFFTATDARALALAQGGDLMGGASGSPVLRGLTRKSMNSYICSVDRPFDFFGLVNEDVNAYALHGSRGVLFFTFGEAHLNQAQTQANRGGLTTVYIGDGTYVKSFYTVMACPSFARIATMGSSHPRFHHVIDWPHAVPLIVSEEQRRI